MTGLVPRDDFKRLQKRMNRLMEEFGISDPEARYMPEIRKIQDKMNQLIDDFAVDAPATAVDAMAPLADVKETDDEVIVDVDLPGMDKGDVEISVAEDLLEIKAERKSEKVEKGEEFYRKERSYTRFERSLKLPAEVRGDDAKATLKDGVLTVRLPKMEVTTRRKVKVE